MTQYLQNHRTGMACKMPDRLDDIDIRPWDMLEGTINHLPMNIAPTGVPIGEGIVSWDSANHTMNIQPGIADVNFQVCMEEVIYVYNATATTITDGQAVYMTGAYQGDPTIALAKANDVATTNLIGIVTASIPASSHGFVTVRGKVRGFDASAYANNTPLYLSATTAGSLTATIPLPPNYAVPVATVYENTATGSIYVNVANPSPSINATFAAITSLDPTGWLNPEGIDVSYDSPADTITLTGDLRYTWRGIPLSLTSPWTSSAHPAATPAVYYLSSVDGLTFTWSSTPWLFSDMQVAYVYHAAGVDVAIREVHGTMSWPAHEEFHTMIGCYKKSGGAISNIVVNSTTAANRRPFIASTVIKDEDVITTNALHNSALYTKIYLTGTGTTTFIVETAEIVPVLVNNPYWNSYTTPNWSQTLMANNSYMSVWLIAIPATSEANSQKFRYVWMQGQTNGTLAAETALTPETLDLGQIRGVFTEFVFMTQLILRFQGGDWDIQRVKDLTRRLGL